MNILLLSVKDVKKGKYRREGTKNLIDAELGSGDTIALCGRLENIKYTKYGPRIWFNDNDSFSVVVGTFNKNVRKDAELILEKFQPDEESYVLVYGNPYETDKLYVNVNHDNGVIIVDREMYERFHQMRQKAKRYLMGKKGLEVEEERPLESVEGLSNAEILAIVKRMDQGQGVRLEQIMEAFDASSREFIEEKIFELMETGDLYEPTPGILRAIS